MKLKQTKVDSLENCAYKLGIHLIDLKKIIIKMDLSLTKDFNNRMALKENDFDSIVIRDDLQVYRDKNLGYKYVQILENSSKEINHEYKLTRGALLDFLETKINRLTEIHEKVSIVFNNEESALNSVIILYSKIIANCRASIILLRNDNWNIGSLMRELMECDSMAKYFFENQENNDVKKDLLMWYRGDRSPRLTKVRSLSAKKYAKIFPKTDEQYHYDLESDVYNKKSKFTHSSYGSIIETANVIFEGNNPKLILNTGKKYQEYNLFDISTLLGRCINPLFPSFATFLYKSDFDRDKIFSEFKEIDKEIKDFIDKIESNYF